MMLNDAFILLVRKNSLSFLICSLAIFTKSVFANEQIVVAVGLAKPPYVIQQNNSGFELELLRNVFQKMGKLTKFVYTSFGHSSKMLEVKEIDAIMTTNQYVVSDTSKLSNTYITYQNVAISLKENNLSINTINDLANYSMASFQKADKVLGPEFSIAAKQSPLHLKIGEQKKQPILLLKKRVDVLIMDINIFKYLIKELGLESIDEKFTFHFIFPKSSYQVAFKNKENISIFNNALANYQNSEAYLLLKERYNF